MPILAVFNRSFINELTSALGSSGISLPILASVVGIFCVSPNLMSAPSVSLEGKTLWICRSLPVESRSILLSKAALHFAVSEPAVLFSSILFAILLKATPLELLVMLIVPTAYVAFTSLLGVGGKSQVPAV